jgi:hypothetical protein
MITELSIVPDPHGITREFPLCFSGSSLESATLLLGALSRAETHAAPTPRLKKRTTERE